MDRAIDESPAEGTNISLGAFYCFLFDFCFLICLLICISLFVLICFISFPGLPGPLECPPSSPPPPPAPPPAGAGGAAAVPAWVGAARDAARHAGGPAGVLGDPWVPPDVRGRRQGVARVEHGDDAGDGGAGGPEGRGVGVGLVQRHAAGHRLEVRRGDGGVPAGARGLGSAGARAAVGACRCARSCVRMPLVLLAVVSHLCPLNQNLARVRTGGGGATRQHANYWAPRTRKRHQREHRPQRPKERSDPTQHAKGRTGDCPGPRKETTTRRTVTQGAKTPLVQDTEGMCTALILGPH